ncbi:hypothetical protein GCM10027062_44770 [Nocardioides hungaricus]
MDTSGDGGTDPAAAVAEGLRRTAAAMGHPAAAARGRRIYRRTRDAVDPVVRHEGAVMAAFPSVLLEAGRTRSCLVLGLPATILVTSAGCRPGRASTVLRLERSRIVRVEVVPAPPGVPAPSVLRVDDGSRVATFALPRGVVLFGP